jgi:hypothetical protein
VAYRISNLFDEVYLIKDLIPKDYQDAIIELIKGDNGFPWYTINKIGHNQYFGEVEDPYDDPNISDFGGLYHLIMDDGVPRSDDFDFFIPILEHYCNIMNKKISEIFRIRMRYTHPVPNHDHTKYAAPHVDFEGDVDFTTLVYYVDDSDGDTILFSKMHKPGVDIYDPVIKESLEEVYRHTPAKGEAIVFNGHRYHAGNYPINKGRRIVINFDFVEHEA